VKVRFTPSGRRGFLAVVAFLLEENPPAAEGFRKKAEKRLRRLARFPRSGRAIPEFPDLPHREVLCPPYRFFYRIQGKTVWIVSVLHGARIPQAPGE
jgi:toxin ParE1/3/4